MLEQTGNQISFYGFFTAAKVGKTGLTVTCDVYNPAGSLIVSAGSAVAIGGGLYRYDLSSGSVSTTGEYLAVLKTGDTTVDQQHVPALWSVGKTWVSRVDATISSRSSHTAAQAAAAVWDYLVSAATTVGSLGKRVVDFLDAAISSRSTLTAAQVDTQLSGTHGAGSWDSGGGATAAEVWSYSTRALTQSAAQVAAIVAGSAITIKRGDAITIALTGLGSLAGRSKLWFTVKSDLGKPDSQAIIQIEETAGLLYLNRAAATANQATLVVDNATTGDITITIAAVASAQLAGRSSTYDVQVLTDDGIRTLTESSFLVTNDVTRSVT